MVSEERLITARDLFALRFVGEPQLSPDGAQVAFVVTTIDEVADEYRSRVWVVPADGMGQPRPLTSGEKADTAPRWSPDGRRLAFLSTRGGRPQLYVLDLAGGEAAKVTELKGGAGEPVWSPDGRALAFSAPVGGVEEDTSKTKEERERQEAKEPLRIDRLRYRFDGAGYIHGKPAVDKRRHLFVVPLAESAAGDLPEAKQITDGDWHDDAPAWSPDGQHLAFASYREPDADRSFRSDLWVVAADGGEPRKLTASDGNVAGPSWSPDGKTIAYFATMEDDQPYATSRVWMVRASGRGKPRAVVPTFDRDANGGPISDQTLPGGTTRPVWSDNSRALSFLVGDSGDQGLWRVAVTGTAPTRIIGGPRALAGFSIAAGTIAFAAQDGAHPAELFAVSGAGKGQRQLTDFNRDFLERKAISAPEQFRFTSGEDEIDGWLIRPVERPADGKYPLIVMIHGGPHTQYGNAFFHEFQFLAARGFGVFFCNPHGSSGRGAAFAKALTARWGEVDMPDQMAGLDSVLGRGEGDPERLGVGVGSYGGFMTNWIIGHTDRFKAAVSMRSIANLLNFWGTSDIFHIGSTREWGHLWDHFERYKKFSPIMYARNFTTPTLILHQEEDYRCPIEQGEQLFAALRLHNVPARMVRFPQESHGLSRNGQPRHRLQRLEEMAAWYERYLR